MIDGKILAPASDQAGKPQQNPGERGIDGGCRGQGTQRQINLLRLGGRQIGGMERPQPNQVKDHSPGKPPEYCPAPRPAGSG